jgi:Immunoglobulin I-set domain/Immunoglobulin domain
MRVHSVLGRAPALVLSAVLQLAPLLRVAPQEARVIAPVLVAVVRWVIGVSAAAGSIDAVSGATGLTLSGPTRGTNGVAFAGLRASILSGAYGSARSYSATGLPPGLKISLQGVVTGIPTAANTFVAQITGWKDSAPGSGHNYTGFVTFVIVNPPGVPPAFTQTPQPVTVTEGAPAVFTAAATGTPAPAFQWLFGGAAISGATGAQYQIAKTALTNAGGYSVIALNTAGSVTSAPVALTVLPAVKPPVVTNPPASLTVVAGDAAAFSVVAGGAGPLTYQWLFNSKAISGATNVTLSLVGVATNQSGAYAVTVSNSGGPATSAPATLTVLPGPIQLSALGGGSDGVTLAFPVIAGVAYAVEAKAALDQAIWSTLTNWTASATGTTTAPYPAGSAARIYRVRALP